MRTPAFLDPVMNKLRGEYKSVRYQFIGLPIEWAKFGWYRLTGRSWIDFYSSRMNASSGVEIEKRPNETYVQEGQVHLGFLVENSLKPSHSFLDLGCGVLRTALYVVPYLQPHKYVGVEIAVNRVNKGRFIMRDAGIADDRYEIIITDNPELRELSERKFDVIWANSVLTHMPEDDIRLLLQAIKKNIAPGGSFFFTFSERETPQRIGIKDFFHPEPWMRALCEGYGFQFETIPTQVKSFGTMARLRLHG